MAQIYGIDLSKDKFDVNYLDSNGQDKSLVYKNNLGGISKFLESVGEDAVLCAEHTGVYGAMIEFICTVCGVKLALCPGYVIKHSLGMQKGKTDKIDAKRIREYAERFSDKLRYVYHSDEALSEVKELYNFRTQLVKERKMLMTRNRGRNHLPFNSLTVHSVTVDLLKSMDHSIARIEAEIERLIVEAEGLRDNFELLKTIPGIGLVVASGLIIKTGNFKRVSNPRAAASLAGVCPFPNASGKMVKKSKVSNLSDKELKSLLYLCSVNAVRYNAEYKLYKARKLEEKKPYFLVMNNIANKILRTAFAVVETKTKYELGHEAQNPRNIKNTA